MLFDVQIQVIIDTWCISHLNSPQAKPRPVFSGGSEIRFSEPYMGSHLSLKTLEFLWVFSTLSFHLPIVTSAQSLLGAFGLFCSHFYFHPQLKVCPNHRSYRQSTVQVAWCSLTVSSKCHLQTPLFSQIAQNKRGQKTELLFFWFSVFYDVHFWKFCQLMSYA